MSLSDIDLAIDVEGTVLLANRVYPSRHVDSGGP